MSQLKTGPSTSAVPMSKILPMRRKAKIIPRIKIMPRVKKTRTIRMILKVKGVQKKTRTKSILVTLLSKNLKLPSIKTKLSVSRR